MNNHIVICLDGFERYRFFKRMLQALDSLGYRVSFLTFKLSIYNKVKTDGYNAYLVKKIQKWDCGVDLSRTLEVSSKMLNEPQAKVLYFSTFDFLEKFLTNAKIALFFIWNGCKVSDVAVTEFATKHKIKTLFFEIANLPGKIFVDPKGVNAKSKLAEDALILNKFSEVDDLEYDQWKKQYLALKLEKHIVPQAKSIKKINYKYPIDLYGYIFRNIPIDCNFSPWKRLKKKMLLAKAKLTYDNVSLTDKYVFFPMQVSNDSQILLNSEFNNIDAIKYAYDLACNIGAKLYVKPHPAEASVAHINQVYALRKELKFNFVEDNTFKLLDNAQKVVTINSTVGLEGMIMGKPTIVLGKTFYQNFSHSLLKKYIFKYLVNINYFEQDQITFEAVKHLFDRFDI